jgi:hypothetical protein
MDIINQSLETCSARTIFQIEEGHSSTHTWSKD